MEADIHSDFRKLFYMAIRDIHIGTSGWNYNHWRECFYPKKLRQAEWLAFYCRHFDTVEVNNTFYKLPTKKALENWRSTVPENFCFSVKASRFITHMKKLKDGQETIHNFMEKVEPLDGKLGPLLFQLPPKWRLDIGRFKSFIEALPKNRCHIFEFRDPSWWDPRVYDLMRKYNIGFCIYNMHDKSSPREMTSDTAYIRLHGPGNKYNNGYTERMLSQWAEFISDCNTKRLDIYCYFNNDERGNAVANASRLKKILGISMGEAGQLEKSELAERK